MTEHERADRTAGNAVVLAAAEVIGKAGSIVYTVLAARALSEAGYGAFAYAVATSLLVASVVSWGFDELLIQRTSGRGNELPAATAQALTSKLVVGVPLFLVVGAALVPSRPTSAAAWTLLLVFAAAMLDLVSDTGRAAATARERLVGVSVALIVNRIVTAGLAVAALLAGGGLLAIATAYLVGSASGVIATAVVLARLGIRLVPGGRLRVVGTSMRTSWALGLTTVLGLVLFRIDTVIIEAIEGDAAVGRYTVAYRLVENVLFIAWSFGRAVFPVVTERGDDLAAVRRIVARTNGGLATVYVPFAAVAALRAPEVLGLVFGAPYGVVSAPSLVLLAGAPLAFGLSYVLGMVLIARGDFVPVLLVYATATVVNVVANLLLVPTLGERGAAIATVGSYALEAALAWYVVRRRATPTNPVAEWGPAVLAGGAMVVALLVVRQGLLVDLAVAGVVYAAAWWPLARRLTPDQSAQVERLVGRVRRLIPVGR